MAFSRTYYLRNVNSDISGYLQLSTSYGTGFDYRQGPNWSQKWATNSGEPNAIRLIGNTKTWVAYIYNAGSNSALAHITYQLIKRNVSGSETILQQGDWINQEVDGYFDGTISVNIAITSQTLSPSDRIVLRVDGASDNGADICFYFNESNTSRISLDFNQLFSTTLSEVIAIVESYYKKIFKIIVQGISLIEAKSLKFFKVFSETIMQIESYLARRAKVVLETLSLIESKTGKIFKQFSELATLVESIGKKVMLLKKETQTLVENKYFKFIKSAIVETIILKESKLILRKIYSGGEWIWEYVFKPTYWKARNTAMNIWNKFIRARGK